MYSSQNIAHVTFSDISNLYSEIYELKNLVIELKGKIFDLTKERSRLLVELEKDRIFMESSCHNPCKKVVFESTAEKDCI